MKTYSGFKVQPLDLRVGDVRIEDIAHALSNQCRFGGHTRRFYSVAEHSVWVSQLCDQGHALWGLLHDAAEAYLVDLPRPIKRSPGLEGYKRAETAALAVIATRFGLEFPEPEDVRQADEMMLAVEGYQLCHGIPSDAYGVDRQAVAEFLVWLGMAPVTAESAFLTRYAELTR